MKHEAPKYNKAMLIIMIIILITVIAYIKYLFINDEIVINIKDPGKFYDGKSSFNAGYKIEKKYFSDDLNKIIIEPE